MRFSKFIAMAALVVLPFGAALAHTYDEVLPLVGTETPPADIVTAVNGSKDVWLPRHVYGLLDKGAPKEVVQAAAAKAAVFYDASVKSLEQTAQEVRLQQPAQTIRIAGPADWATFFAFFEKAKTDIDAAKASVAPITTPIAGELDSAFDKRVRLADEDRARKMAVPEGRVVQTTWEIDLPATLDGYDEGTRCFPKASVTADLTASFAAMRATMGGTKPEYAITTDPKESKTVLSARFTTTDPNKKFEAVSKPICMYPDEAPTLKSHGVALRLKVKRAPKGEAWSATGNFVDAKTGEPVLVKK